MEILDPVTPKREYSATSKSWKSAILSAIEPLGTLDLRALGMMRIGISLVLLLDICIRLGDLEAHYTNLGVLPLTALFEYAWHPYHFSVYTGASSFPWMVFLFGLNIVCVLCLMLGYRTRLFTFLCWVFLLSLHNRNPLVHQGGDDLLRLILFWSLFLPWGYCYSMDARISRIKPKHKCTLYSSFACFGYILQIFYVYFFSALHKTSPEWTTEFTALYYALSLDQILMPFGKLIYPFEGFLKVLTAATYYTEMLLPFVLLIPFFTGGWRLLFIIVIGMLHLGIALSLNVGLFPLISTMAMIALLPSFVMNKLDLVVQKISSRYLPSVQNAPIKQQRGTWLKEKPTMAILAIFFIIYTFSWNLRTVNVPLGEYGMQWIGHTLRVDQFWSMFAPAVFKDDGWFIVEATTEKGDKIDLLNHGRSLSFDRPEYIAGTYKNDRWRKYSENILFIYNSHYREYYCNYLMRKWNTTHDNKVNRVEIIYMKVPTLPNYEEDGPFVERLCICSLD